MASVPTDASCATLAATLLPYGLRFPPDPLDRAVTIGQMLAANKGGRRRLYHGTIASYVRGATLQRATGPLLLGTQTVKNATGYALAALLAGTTTSSVARLTLSLRPLPPGRGALLLRFASSTAACAAANELLAAALTPTALALLDANTQTLLPATLPLLAGGTLLLAEFEGYAAPLRRQLVRATELAESCGGQCLLEADHDEALAACWALWEATEALVSRQDGTTTLCVDLSLPRTALAAFVQRAEAIARHYRLHLALWGEAGLANLHPTLLWQGDRLADATQAALLLWRAAIDLGGTAGGERGNPRLPVLATPPDALAATLLAEARAAIGS